MGSCHWSIFNWRQATTRSLRSQELFAKFLRYQTIPLSVEIPFLQTQLFAEVSLESSSSPHPTTTCVTGTFTPHNRKTSLLKSCHFSNFSFSFSFMRASPATAMSIIWHNPCCLSKNTMSGPRCSMTWSVWMVKSHSSFPSSDSPTLSGTCLPFTRFGLIILLRKFPVDNSSLVIYYC